MSPHREKSAMKSNAALTLLRGALFAGLFLLPTAAVAGTGYATFESFYRTPTSLSWILAAVSTLILAGLVFVAFAPASPVVLAIGTWIGSSFLGLSGAAATNAGLALLGGGAIVSGGFGIIGGAAVLTAALTFGTEITIDYAAGKAIEEYQYRKFVEASEKMITLPLPRNTTGPASYKAALKILENSKSSAMWDRMKEGEFNELWTVLKGQGLRKHESERIRDAIAKMGTFEGEALSSADTARKQSLMALLYFLDNDYKNTSQGAGKAYKTALSANEVATLPAFLFAVSSLYDDKVDFGASFRHFTHAIASEPENPLTPLLFAIYLDRLMYRMNDGQLETMALEDVRKLSNELALDDRQLTIQQGVLMRYLMRLKLEQQKISSLTGSASGTIKDSPQTVKVVRESLREYEGLVSRAGVALLDQQRSWEKRALLPRSRWPTPFGTKEEDKLKTWKENLDKQWELIRRYDQDKTRLAGLVGDLERYQDTPWIIRQFQKWQQKR